MAVSGRLRDRAEPPTNVSRGQAGSQAKQGSAPSLPTRWPAQPLGALCVPSTQSSSGRQCHPSPLPRTAPELEPAAAPGPSPGPASAGICSLPAVLRSPQGPQPQPGQSRGVEPTGLGLGLGVSAPGYRVPERQTQNMRILAMASYAQEEGTQVSWGSALTL